MLKLALPKTIIVRKVQQITKASRLAMYHTQSSSHIFLVYRSYRKSHFTNFRDHVAGFFNFQLFASVHDYLLPTKLQKLFQRMLAGAAQFRGGTRLERVVVNHDASGCVLNFVSQQP